jgi:hypothetical protein
MRLTRPRMDAFDVMIMKPVESLAVFNNCIRRN